MNDKVRPVHERLAAIQGSGTFKDLREGFGPSLPTVTMQDVMAALSYMKANWPHIQLSCEILQTYFGSTQVFRRQLVHGYLNNNRVEPKYIVAHRMGATLAAQVLAGVKFSQDADKEFAFICNIRYQVLIDLRAHALRWFDNRMTEAEPKFAEAVKDVVVNRLNARAQQLLEASIKHDDAVRKRAAQLVTAVA